MSGGDRPAGGPWYRYFWPWFIVALLGTSIAAGITTAVIAFQNADERVDSPPWTEP